MSIFPSYSFDSFWIAMLYYVVWIIIVSPVFRFWGGLYRFINCATAMIKFLHRPRSYFGGVELLCPKISILKSFNDCTIGFYKPSPPNSSIGGEKKPWLFLFTFSWLLVILNITLIKLYVCITIYITLLASCVSLKTCLFILGINHLSICMFLVNTKQCCKPQRSSSKKISLLLEELVF